MRNPERYPFLASDPTLGEASFRPYLLFTLVHQQVSSTASGLLDTGASVNVLPYSIGVELSVNWRKAYRVVKNLRQRVYRATRQQDWSRVRNLQRLLLKNDSTVLLAVRRVTQINVGKHTPGIDKLLVKTGPAKAILVDALKQSIPWRPLPTRQVYIPKRNGNRRPLRIPSIIDRCLQAMVKSALEPCWEAQYVSIGSLPRMQSH